GSLRQPGSLSPWLYGVAYRTAIKARAMAAQRRFHETQAMAMQPSRSIQETDSSELKELLDDEVNRLPVRYRSAVILCYMSGKTNEEAARQLGCAPGTIFSRLARAREMLRNRLTRRGIVVSAGLITVLTASSTPAVVSSTLVETTVKA